MPEKREQFATEFITKLNGKIPDYELKTVLQELQVFVNDYDIEERETGIVPYGDFGVPDCYKVYMVSKKIEGLSKNTLKTYDYYLRDFFNHMDKPLEKITSNDVRLYLYNLQERKKITNRSLDGKRLVINTFMEWCKNEGYITSNPCKKIGQIKYEAKKREPLTDIEMELLRSACETYREKAIIEMLYSTGCRVSELITLDRKDVDFQTKEVLLFGKGSKHRISYINAKAEVALKKYLFTRRDMDKALFVTERDPHRMCKETVEKLVKKIGERAEIGRRVYPHLIRHTTATDALNRGMDVTEVQRLLGHEKLDTTMIYAKVSQESIKHDHRKYIV